jgi:glycerol-3-phosphate dehydrogenase
LKNEGRERVPHPGSYDVVIIGAGIVGTMIARELSKLEGRFALLEKEPFPCFGASKAGLSQIHLPDFCPPGSLKGRLCKDAPLRFRSLASDLDVLYREVGELWLALKPEHVAGLEAARLRGEFQGAKGFEMIGPERIREIEPHVTSKAMAGLYARGLGVVYVPEWGFALVENAVQNGVRLHLQTSVLRIENEDDSTYRLVTSRGTIRTKFLINAAGIHADEIAWMVGDKDICLNLRKGTMVIFDKAVSHLVNNMLYGTFSDRQSQDIAPTAHGNIILGVHYVKPDHKEDTKVSRQDILETVKLGKELVPALSEKEVITAFSGILPTNNRAPDGDFHIGPSERAPGVINVLVGAPGLTAAPGIADLVIQLLRDQGMMKEEKKDFSKKRLGWLRFEPASLCEKQRIVDRHPKYGRVLCRCEQVTEAEIVEAVRRGADTMDGVKHLTRAGMGRCQGSFCGPLVLNCLARVLHVVPTRITKRGAGSQLVVGFTKESPTLQESGRC